MVTREFNQDVLKGFVISSDPGAGTERHAGSAIALTVSKGSPVEVADVTGASVADATSELEQAGLKVKIATQQVNSSSTRARSLSSRRRRAARSPTATPSR